MKFKLDLPFHATEQYATTIAEQYQDITYSVYFGMPSLGISDARILFQEPDVDLMIETLSLLPSHVKKYITMNGRYTPLAFYDEKNLKRVVNAFQKMIDAGMLDGIIYLDFYHLTMLATLAPSVFSQLEAVPSINCYIDNIDKFNAQLVYIDSIGMKTPSKIIIDRSLNRRMDAIKEFSAQLRKKHPTIQIEMLVNEGCLYQCPFKINHDIVISLVNDVSMEGQQYLREQHKESSFNAAQLNEEWGCIKYLDDNPGKFFQIPFVRPEDIHHYEGHVDILKLSGKVLPDDTVYQIIEAYKDGYWDGNLLTILDASGSLRQTHYVFNDSIPDTFHKMLTTCDKNCLKCNYCDTVAKTTTQRLVKKKEEAPNQEADYCPSSTV